MRYIANVSAYEVLDTTRLHFQVGQWSPEHPKTERLCELSFTVPSKGVEDPREWLRDMLQACLAAI